MAHFSHDGQSFIIDGRRIWLVSGSIHYPRVPHQLWASRIRAAKQAGLNCISTFVFWNVHEPVPGKFNFEADANLRRFIELIGAEGMYCILRPGPYIGADWDFGGLPAWLNNIEGIQLREGNGPFLKACARYLGAVMEQVRDLQVTNSSNGPIVLIQAENEWECHNPNQGEKYLCEIVRYMRENGVEVPISLGNNLWQRVDGTIDTWNAKEHLLANLRQLRVVQPDAPRLVSGYQSGWFDCWGHAHEQGVDATANIGKLAQILAVGAQYNLVMFHGGTNFAFAAGRAAGGVNRFVTTSYDYDAPLAEGGGRGDKFLAVKLISTFANQFAQVFANLDPELDHVAVNLVDDDHRISVIHQRGSSGDVIFLLKAEHDDTTHTNLLMTDGLSLPVAFGTDRTAWLLTGVNLAGAGELTYTNLRPWAFVGRRMLVLFGPAGEDGIVAVNGAPFHIQVPGGAKPNVEVHEQLTVVVLSREQVDAAYLLPDGLVVGACGLDGDDKPLPHPDWKTMCTISADGQIHTIRVTPLRRPAVPKLATWQQALLTELINGQSDQYESISEPVALESLACSAGYGWYRFSIKAVGAGPVLAPQAGDRLHFFHHGKLAAILGVGPVADENPVELNIDGRVTILADNLGRFSQGWAMGEPKGLAGHIYSVKPVQLAKARVITGREMDPFEAGGCLVGLRVDDPAPRQVLAWKFSTLSRKPMVLDIQSLPWRAMILVNNRVLAMHDPCHGGAGRFFLQVGAEITGGQNELRIAPFNVELKGSNPDKFIKLYQCTENLTSKSHWAFAPWTVPDEKAFGPLGRAVALPCWYRSSFMASPTDTPLWLEPCGMTKGQIFINGHNAGRYFVSTAANKAVGPQKRYYLPQPWLHDDKPNELVLFDEHGRNPGQCRLVYDANGSCTK